MAETAFYVYELARDGQHYIGYGITNDFEARNYQHNRTFMKTGVEVVRSFVKVCSSRALAIELEKSLKVRFSGLGLDIDGFKTESLPKEMFGEFKEFVSSFDFGKEIPDIPKSGIGKSTHYNRIKQLHLTNSELETNKKLKWAFEKAFEPNEAFGYLKSYVDLRSILSDNDINNRTDLVNYLDASEDIKPVLKRFKIKSTDELNQLFDLLAGKGVTDLKSLRAYFRN